MSICDAVSDRMPAVASGRSEWTPEEQAHLASCDDCAAEWALQNAASRLGRDVIVDVTALAPVVLERVRAARAKDQRSWWVKRAVVVGTLAIAALLLLVMVGRQVDPVPPPNVAANVGELQLAELDDAAPAELEIVLAEFDAPALPESSLDGPDIEGLDQSQVEQALRSWEES